uniref:Uncharacterized protein n=2 Tax=Parascaris univalens TaxID=6257 RepID=A0A915AUK6_PARUN
MPPGAGIRSWRSEQRKELEQEKEQEQEFPAMTTVDQLMFSQSFSGNLGWPNTVEEMGTINALALAFGVKNVLGLDSRSAEVSMALVERKQADFF